ncbi:MAG TPA: hypothetical protein VEX36_08290 [Thermoleophilaceae bacterium]|nr:hypothetical protein [Thermoleophilaceae bacterium]
MASAAELIRGFEPETELERRVVEDPVVLEGLAWGEPRRGHPEGPVGHHVADLLETIDAWGEQDPRRAELRFVALVHDALKYKVHDWLPRTGPNHHAARARRLAERYVDDERLLATIELHDRPYGIWRKLQRTGELDEQRFDEMIARLPDLGFFLRFVELDGSTEGKRSEPLEWFKAELARRGLEP